MALCCALFSRDNTPLAPFGWLSVSGLGVALLSILPDVTPIVPASLSPRTDLQLHDGWCCFSVHHRVKVPGPRTLDGQIQ